MRKVSKTILNRLLNDDLVSLLDYIKSDAELRLEVRTNGNAFVYYRKGKALEIKNLKVDKKYGDVPSGELARTNPGEYFTQIKSVIDKWLKNNKRREEFDTQQNIARNNQDLNDRYIVLDMEYGFEQSELDKTNRNNLSLFDLLAIDKIEKKIVFFELKKGAGSLSGKSGVESHILDYERLLNGRNKEFYRKQLLQDIRNIILDKTELGILSDYSIPDDIHEYKTELVFVFHPNSYSEISAVKNLLNDRYKLLVVTSDNYKLK